jgi:cytochrome c-type biogenesis protein CcmH
VARARLAAALLGAVVALGTAPLTARDGDSRAQAATLASQLMSPFCPGRLLTDCTSPQAFDLREAIAGRLAAGESVDAVRADLLRQYGDAILGAPRAEGVGVLAWILPALLGAVTLAGVAWKVAQATRLAVTAGPAVATAGATAGDTALFAQLDDELRQLD